ncbi:MAG: protein kinase [Halioglobus sp.]|nr:protein kinase [Halioglobus sp.]
MNDPDRLGKYRIDGILGEGGMGVIYRGYDEDVGQAVAIKTIRPNLLKGRAGRELQERFLREAQAQIRLHHPNIVPIFEFQPGGEEMPFFAMEYVEGKSLKEYLALGMHCNLDLSLHIISQVLDALAFSHRKGVVHRDIKPANILFLEDDYYSVKIVDFGIARMEESDYTQTGRMMGTPQYYSPEQGLGQKVDARSDLYSTALVWYELLTCEKLSLKLAASTHKHGVTDEHLARLQMYPPETRKVLKSVLLRALATDPDKRFQSASEFSAALQPLLQQPEPSQRRHSTRWLGGSAVLALVLLLAVAYVAFRDGIGWPDFFGEALEPVPRVALNAEQRQQLAERLRRGDLHLAVGRLIAPQGSNAAHSYQRALEIDPGNTAAREGLQAVQRQVLVQLQEQRDRGQAPQQCNELQVARGLFPDNARFAALWEQLQCRG